MNISQLLEALKGTSSALSVGEKLLAGISVTILSMVVVIIVLTLIAVLINILQIEKPKPKDDNDVIITPTDTFDSQKTVENDTELVSVITAAICASTGNSIDNLIVKKIIRNNNSQSAWQTMTKNTTK